MTAVPKSPKTPAQVHELVIARLLSVLAEVLEGMVEDRQRSIQAQEEAAAAETAALPQGPDVSRDREAYVEGCALGPDSLTGSWFHRVKEGEVIWQGCIVAEVWSGPVHTLYMVELHNWENGKSAHQRLISSARMFESDENDVWRFYDTAAEMQAAYEGVVNQAIEPQSNKR